MDPAYDEEFKLHGDTMRHLETLAHAPGELQFRINLVQAIKDMRKELAEMRREISQRLDKLENRKLIGELQVARIAKKELEDDKEIAQMKVDVKRLWKGATWLLTVIAALVLGGVIHGAVFK